MPDGKHPRSKVATAGHTRPVRCSRRKANSATVDAPTSPGYWRQRLVLRPYSNQWQPSGRDELSALIESDGTRYFFPLGTNDPAHAAAAAATIQTGVARLGWTAICADRPREFTIAIIWNWAPFAATYTTLRSTGSMPPPKTQPPPTNGRAKRLERIGVLAIEPDASLHGALRQLLDLQPGFECAAIVANPAEAGRIDADHRPALVLANRQVEETAADASRLSQLIEEWPEIPFFRFGIFEDSNYIFHSVSGIPSGYILRRRPPPQLLEPITSARTPRSFDARALQRGIRQYFQSLFDRSEERNQPSPLARLTQRELETLEGLAKGRSDKEIADQLRISVWTVHGHVKRIFEKLGVHSRTEAVVRCLQT